MKPNMSRSSDITWCNYMYSWYRHTNRLTFSIVYEALFARLLIIGQQRNFQLLPVFQYNLLGGGPRVVVSTAAFHARVRLFVSRSRRTERNVSSPSTCETQYCGGPPWPIGSVPGLRPPGFKFRILCLEGSVISLISPSSGGSAGPI